MVAVVLLSLVAAAVFGTAVALQSYEARRVDAAASLRPGLLVTLAKRPIWLIGLAGDVGGFAIQTAALTLGSIVVVQPLLTLGLLVALGVGARLDRRRLLAWEWRAVAGVLVGLVVFFVAAQPTSASKATATTTQWWLTAVIVIAAIAIVLIVGRRATTTPKAVLFAVATGCAEAAMAVISKAFGDKLADGLLATLESWEPLALIIGGIVTLLLVQSTYQLERSTVTLPVITVSEPLISTIIGVALFGERIHFGVLRGFFTILGLALVVRSLIAVARDPALATSRQEATR
jgi:drug/metabolite transporter (DMT)-like permease